MEIVAFSLVTIFIFSRTSIMRVILLTSREHFITDYSTIAMFLLTVTNAKFKTNACRNTNFHSSGRSIMLHLEEPYR